MNDFHSFYSFKYRDKNIDRMIDTHLENANQQLDEWKKEMNVLMEKLKCDMDDNQKDSLHNSIKLLYFNIVLLEDERLSRSSSDNHYHSNPVWND